MEPKISVIVPVYNVESCLERCVESLRKQSLQEIEIILVDDGSTDSSGRLCDEYGETDKRIKVIHKKNEGQGIARNCGLDIASGKYIAFVDSDDYMNLTAYEKITALMDREKAQLCAFGYVKQNEQGSIFYRSKIGNECFEKEEIRTKFVGHFFGDEPGRNELSGVSACMTVFYKEIIDRHGIRFPSEREVASEDTVFNLDYCMHIEKALTMSEEFYHYCQKAGSFSKGYIPGRYEKGIRFCYILKEYAQQYGIGERVNNRIRMFFWGTLMDCIKQEISAGEGKSAGNVYKRIRELCRKKEVREMLDGMETEGMNGKQKLLLYFVKRAWTLPVMVLGYLRVKRGL